MEGLDMAGWTRLPKEQQEAIRIARDANTRATVDYYSGRGPIKPPNFFNNAVARGGDSTTTTGGGVSGGPAVRASGDLWTLVALAAGAFAGWRTFEYLAVTGVGSVWLMLAGAAATGYATFKVVDSTFVRTVSFALLKIGFVLAIVGVMIWAARNHAGH